ncbi:hypothetical protein NIES37_49950 [Tolypothrix tenuis PCC 7101]|uniref:Knr4/Smi1-like domain-containing protein n=1 Tax=Tolypothrix tenuis PCC 7101 TaxID=231146 RepID=A0A1Z4N5L1_9CYAN|nr:hypothetical protein [Aulosira sp. FACHB-113]BAZ00997.1 hypothetical protein NIES37_49950 [Tolypothrix tenuis PCC 7101]BAZ75080.1 hypothetical protein NIES50_36600 [Aulosira laxa NIES-50]
MKNYVEKFETLVREVESNQFLEVTEFKVNSPISKQKLADIEVAIEKKLDKSIINFYRQMNGLTLNWRVKPDLANDEQAFEKIRDRYDDYYIKWPEDETDAIPFAKIDILPLENCLIERNWQEIIIPQPDETIEFANVSYQHSDFTKRLKPFDVFSDYSCMSFILENDNDNPKVLLLSDYYIEWEESRITDFESYLEMLLVTRGIVESRSRIYGEYEGHKKPLFRTPEAYWIEHQQYVPKLFRGHDLD